MKAVRLGKAEATWVLNLVEGLDRAAMKKSEQNHAVSIARKIREALTPGPPGVAAGPLEEALIAAARGKVVPLPEGNGYPRVSRMATAVGATPDTARLVGAWMASQRWLTGPFTIFTVLSKWPDWYARAMATRPPDGIEQGIADVGPGPGQKRPASAAGRRPAGIG